MELILLKSKNMFPQQVQSITLLSSKENIYDYYNIMDLVVLPSRIEPFGIVVIEAGMMNKPFIGSNVDGIAEIIES